LTGIFDVGNVEKISKTKYQISGVISLQAKTVLEFIGGLTAIL
jgi:hypothetical protein